MMWSGFTAYVFGEPRAASSSARVSSIASQQCASPHSHTNGTRSAVPVQAASAAARRSL
jgi:hypothetical protein